MAEEGLKKRIQRQLSPITELVRDSPSKIKDGISSISQTIKHNDTSIVAIAQNLAVSGDGCGVCPSCVIGDAIVGVVGIKYFLSKRGSTSEQMAVPPAVQPDLLKSANVSVFEDDAFRCC